MKLNKKEYIKKYLGEKINIKKNKTYKTKQLYNNLFVISENNKIKYYLLNNKKYSKKNLPLVHLFQHHYYHMHCNIL